MSVPVDFTAFVQPPIW